MIREHYTSETGKRKDKVKEAEKNKETDKSKESEKSNYMKKAFVYSFKLLDLESKMYVAYGMGLKVKKKLLKGLWKC